MKGLQSNGSLSSTEAIKPTLILPSGVTETITNVSGYYGA